MYRISLASLAFLLVTTCQIYASEDQIYINTDGFLTSDGKEILISKLSQYGYVEKKYIYEEDEGGINLDKNKNYYLEYYKNGSLQIEVEIYKDKVYVVNVFSREIQYVRGGRAINNGYPVQELIKLFGDHKVNRGDEVGASITFSSIPNIAFVTNCEFEEGEDDSSCAVVNMLLTGY